MSVNFIDLSHTIEAGTITYKGLPAPLLMADFGTPFETACPEPCARIVGGEGRRIS